MENHLEKLKITEKSKITETEERRALEPNPSTSGVDTPQAEVLGKNPQGKKHEGTGLNRGLSGAQRRKLLKQRAIEEGKPVPKFGLKRKERKAEEKRARTANNSAVPSTFGTPNLTGKRAASSSPLVADGADEKRGQKPLKKAKLDGSYAAAASNLPRVVLTCGDYMGGKMPSEVVAKIQEVIVSKVLAIEEGAFVPRFAESFPRSGTMVFVCENGDSEAWLKETAGDIELGMQDLKIRVVAPEELRITKVMTWLPAGVRNASDFLKLVKRQNEGVDVARWAVLKEAPTGCLILGLDEPSVTLLKSRNLRLTAGVGVATFKVLNSKTAVMSGKEAQEKAQQAE